MWRTFLITAGMLCAAGSALAQGIEGGAERYRFEPGDKVVYEAPLDRCPVGELLPDWKVAKGGYECARFQDQMWIRPFEHGTLLSLPLPAPLPEEFSLELIANNFEPGLPYVRFALHTEEAVDRPEWNWVLLGGVVSARDDSLFGAKERADGNLDCCWNFRRRIPPKQDHRIAVQVRRGQVRFFVDGQRVGHLPFRPEKPPRVLTLYFARSVETEVPFPEAPVLVRGIRIAAYTRPEAAPEAEKDLIQQLGAVETEEGLKVTLAEAILFDFGKWELKPDAQTTLEKLANLAELRRGTVRVEGHTDDVGTEQFNRVLSELRAHVVALALARLGVDPVRLQPKGFGESRPVAPNDSDANRARNRRVEVVLARP